MRDVGPTVPHLMMATGDQDFIAAEHGDRRFMVVTPVQRRAAELMLGNRKDRRRQAAEIRAAKRQGILR